MKIGIDASRAFLRRRTGIEEYSYQTIKHLRDALFDQDVVLYVRQKLEFRNWKLEIVLPAIDFELPKKWRVKGLWAPRFWTQARLSLEMLFEAPEVLFVPAHTVPLLHPKRTIVTIHGLEYEFSPESYGFWERFYMRWSIRHSVRVAECVIAVSENTKRDLVRLYGVPETKISVIHEGIAQPNESVVVPDKTTEMAAPYFFFVGRIETRKNIARMIEAFELFKTQTALPHRLVLAGKPGHGYANIKGQIAKSEYRDAIIETGYVGEAEKWHWLRGAEAFLFPSLYEGFGLPVIEAQQAGVPVIASNAASLPEIAGEGALLIDPLKPEALAEAMEVLVQDREKRADIIDKGARNISRFDWGRCAQSLATRLVE